MPSLIITNPACGNLSGTITTALYVLPQLNREGVPAQASYTTSHPGHAGTILVDFIDSQPTDSQEEVTVIVVSGDGTLHEIVNTLYETQQKRSLQSSTPWPRRKLNFVLVPAGTANALYNSFFPPDAQKSIPNSPPPENSPPPVLSSLRAYIQPGATSTLKPLTLARTVIYPQAVDTCPPPSAPAHPQVVISAVVASTALHASILADSEALRATMPGIERFKIAAQQNASYWYHARARLHPMPFVTGASHQQSHGGAVLKYDATHGTFIRLTEDTYELEGPFSYFLTTVNVDRLEPAFRIAPIARSHPPPPTVPSIDVVVIRPLQDPVIKHQMQADTTGGEASRLQFAEKLWTVMGGAYADGKHLNFRYPSASENGPGGPVSEEGKGPYVVEYFRVSGWDWIPVSPFFILKFNQTLMLVLPYQNERDPKAHILCADGTILNIPHAGKASCTVLPIGSLDIGVHT